MAHSHTPSAWVRQTYLALPAASQPIWCWPWEWVKMPQCPRVLTANTWHCASRIVSLWHSSLPTQLPARILLRGESGTSDQWYCHMQHLHWQGSSNVKAWKTKWLIHTTSSNACHSHTRFVGMSSTPSLARAAHLGVVQLNSIGLLKAVFSICSAKVPVNK